MRGFIEVKDDDDVICGGTDDVVDVNPHTRGKDFEFVANLQNRLMSDEHGLGWIGEVASPISLEGSNGRETGVIDFRLEITPRL